MCTAYLYMEYDKVARVSEGLTLGVRLTTAYSGDQPSSKSGRVQDEWRDATYQPWLPSTRTNVKPEEAKPWVMIRLEGQFGWPGRVKGDCRDGPAEGLIATCT